MYIIFLSISSSVLLGPSGVSEYIGFFISSYLPKTFGGPQSWLGKALVPTKNKAKHETIPDSHLESQKVLTRLS